LGTVVEPSNLEWLKLGGLLGGLGQTFKEIKV
jgi:hypothetical protein